MQRTRRRTWRARAGVRVSVDEVNFTLGWTALQVDHDTLAGYRPAFPTPPGGCPQTRWSACPVWRLV